MGLGALDAGPVPSGKPSSYPDWWFERDVIKRNNANATTTWGPPDYPATDDFAAVNTGQFMNFSVAAYAEMQAGLYSAIWSTGEGQALTTLIEGWNPQEIDAHVVINQGQAKNVAKRIFDVLIKAGYVQEYPWTPTTSDDDSYAVLNIGQAKRLYNFDLSGFDTDLDGMPDEWESTHGLNNEEDDDAREDNDGDGLSNLEEFQNGTNPHDTDTDYDGRSDSQEIDDGTNPDDPASAERLLLSKWRFETAELRGEGLQAPKTSENNELADAWRGKGLDLNGNTTSLLVYKDVEADGRPNINLREGSIRFWIKPAWNSGTGPGDSARLIEVGNYSSGNTTGWWALHFNGNGTQISLATQDAANHGTVNLTSGNLTWAAGQWHQVAVTYSPTETRLYIDGSPSGSAGSGITYLPPAAVRAEGFSIGTDHSHTQRTDSLIDEVECYNYELSAGQIEKDYDKAVALGVDVNANGLPDAWEIEKLGDLEQLATGDPDNDGLSNLDEYERGLDPRNNDTDWDGNSDLQELADGTDPNDFESYTPRKIAHFRFDGPDFILPGGEEPRHADGLEQVDGWKGHCVRINETGDKLAYERSRQDGAPNFTPRRGTLRLWIKTDWATAQMSAYWSRLVNVGAWTSGGTKSYWIVQTHATTNHITFAQCDGDGHTGALEPSVSWPAGQWQQIVFTYSPAGRKFYLNGALIGQSSSAWTYAWNQADLDETGIMFGSDGFQPLKGAMDEAEFFNYELNASEIEDDYDAEIAAHLDTDQNGLFDAWEVEHFGSTGQAPNEDEDEDGLTNAQESLFGTNPRLATGGADTDGDGRSDGQELIDGTNPLVADSAPGTPTEPPTNVFVNTLEPGHHEVTWTNNGPTALFNTIERTGDGRTWKTVGVVGGTAESFTDETAEPDLPYFYRVGAVR